MPYWYGQENLRSQTRILVQRREAEPSLPPPRRVSAQWRETEPSLLTPHKVAVPYRVAASQRVVRRQKNRAGRKNVQMILGICLIVFSLAVVADRVLASNPLPTIRLFSSPQNEQTNQSISLPLSFPVIRISRNVIAFSQADRSQYNNDDPEWSLWSYSACSGCAMAALMDAYGATLNGKPLNCGDVLEVEKRLSVYNPVNEWGLVTGQPDELAETAAQFGFTGYYSQKLSLDDLITLANAGVPAIVRIPTHIMILTGGDKQNVFLADSGGLHLTKVSRQQFLNGLPGSRLYAGQSWMEGWYIILTPDKRGS
jgi:hypothetical protein